MDKRPGSFTAERVLRTRPKTYRAIVRLLAEPDAKIEHIAQRHRVSTHTVRAIRQREAVALAERKQRLVSIFGNVAEIAAERMEELAGKVTLRDAGVTAGIATDKLPAYSGKLMEACRCRSTCTRAWRSYCTNDTTNWWRQQKAKWPC